jgi:hypothetical protein
MTVIIVIGGLQLASRFSPSFGTNSCVIITSVCQNRSPMTSGECYNCSTWNFSCFEAIREKLVPAVSEYHGRSKSADRNLWQEMRVYEQHEPILQVADMTTGHAMSVIRYVHHRTALLQHGAGGGGRTSALYFESFGFEYRPGDRLSWQLLSWFASVPPGKCCDSTLK